MRLTALRLFRPTGLRHTLLRLPQRDQLSNGLTVLTVPDSSGMCGLGFFTKAGCRFETPGQSRGMSWLLERMVYKSNRKHTREEVMQYAYDLSGNFQMKSEFREVLFHTAQCMKWHLPECLEMLSSIVFEPTFTPEDLEAGKRQALKDIDFVFREPSRFLFEHIHQVAYSGDTIGNPHWPEPAELEAITAEGLQTYVQQFWRPDRVSLVVSGVAFEEVQPVLEDLFKKMPPFDALPLPEPFPKAKYTGGHRFIYNIDPPPTMDEKFTDHNNTHVGLIFEGLPESDPDFLALGILQNLLGGGTAFSQGGPGKGMYTKLYRNAINVYGHWLWGIECVLSSFSDTGLIGLYSQAPHQYSKNLVSVTLQQMVNIVEDISEEQLEMAKNQYLSMILMTCEERMPLVEGIGRSWVLFNKLWAPEEIEERVRAMKVSDLVRVGRRLFRSTPTYVVYGNTKDVYSHNDIGRVFADMKRRFQWG
eukprot:EG_transcript_8779